MIRFTLLQNAVRRLIKDIDSKCHNVETKTSKNFPTKARKKENMKRNKNQMISCFRDSLFTQPINSFCCCYEKENDVWPESITKLKLPVPSAAVPS